MKKFIEKLNALKEEFYIDKFGHADFKKKFNEGLILTLPASEKDFCLIAKSRDSFRIQNDIISEIYETHYLFDNYSLQEVSKAVMSDVSDILKGTKSDYFSLKELFTKPPIKHLVVKCINGIKIQNVSKLGNYYFFYNENDLANKAPEIQKIRAGRLSLLFPHLQYPCIGTIVTSVGEEKAREKADLSFQQFENMVQFMSGLRWNKFYIRIVSRGALMRDDDICINQKVTASKSSWKGPLGSENNYCIDDPYFSNIENAMIWKLLEKESRSDWEEKILRSINWIGKGLRSEDITMSFLQMLFSLESLFVVKAPLFLSESITAKIADSVAYVLSNEMKERINITKEMKKIYDLRSKVVHSGKESISLKDANRLFIICKSVLISFFRIDSLPTIKNDDDLFNWFNLKKYS